MLNPSPLSQPFSPEQALGLLDTMLLIRAFEENAEEMYALGKVHGTMHLSIGQEACAVGTASALRPGHDYLLNVHRGHGHFLAWGGDVNRMMAEFMGKETGYCRGRGGSMHIADVEANNLGANGIVAGNMPIAVGVGLSIKARKTDQIVLCLFGDGAANEGAFHESLNMASIWKLPILYLCENNAYAMSMPVRKAINIAQISQRACAYGMPGKTVDGNDLLAVHQAVKEAAEHIRTGNGPYLLELITYRWKGHSKSDKQAYRSREEVKEWMTKDPIRRFAAHIGLQEAALEERRKQAREKIQAAVAFAEASPEPLLETIEEGVYA
ncbi:MAG: thiamine pyrophosphate-dependent dehydrogenase E1 component subunit alpha [Anaerolineales bacterium]|nr:thiamine pyrophosphate-dependent dehydrogenase E1 component subunit alpha [Anaerolineales bacterium]MDW8276448.1 thiamine pyrophosphate-dependent dehydrogenase E1 component subunit alpha [Anaerolineales bacterium]